MRLFCFLAGGLVLATAAYLALYPNPVDWDGMERFNSAIAVTKAVGELGLDPGAVMERLAAFQERYRTGAAGLVIWPPLQVGLLVALVAVLGPGYVTVYVFSYAVLLGLVALVSLGLFRAGRLTAFSVALMAVFYTNPIFLHHVFTLNLRFGEMLAHAAAFTLLAGYLRRPRAGLVYAFAAVAVAAVFYRLTGAAVAVGGAAAFGLAAWRVGRARDLAGPAVLAGVGAAALAGLYVVEEALLGRSFLGRQEGGLYTGGGPLTTFYGFSSYYKGLVSEELRLLYEARYNLPVWRNLVFMGSALVVTGWAAFLPGRWRRPDPALLAAVLAPLGLWGLIYGLHGAKPDYLLPLVHAAFLGLALCVERPLSRFWPYLVAALILLNLGLTYTRTVHPYYEDMHMGRFAELAPMLHDVDTVYVANTPMKHVARYALVHEAFRVREFYDMLELAPILEGLGPNEAVVLNDGHDYRRGGVTLRQAREAVDFGPLAVHPFAAFGADYALVRTKARGGAPPAAPALPTGTP